VKSDGFVITVLNAAYYCDNDGFSRQPIGQFICSNKWWFKKYFHSSFSTKKF